MGYSLVVRDGHRCVRVNGITNMTMTDVRECMCNRTICHTWLSTFDWTVPSTMRPAVAVVSMATSEISESTKITEHNQRQYCKRHGYTYVLFRKPPDESINMYWNKILVINQTLATGLYEWVFWIDADVMFQTQSFQIEAVANAMPPLSIISASTDPPIWSCHIVCCGPCTIWS